MNILIIVIGLLVLIIVTVIVIQPPRLPRQIDNTQHFEAYLARLAAVKQPPGVSVAVVKDGEVVYTYSVGVSDRLNQVNVTSQTVYHWWSMTKVVTAVAVMQLHEKGLLDIEKPIFHYLPEFSNRPANDPLKRITVKQVMRHTAGLPDMIPAMIGWLHYEDVIDDQTDIFGKLLPKYGKLKFEPDEKAAYTNFGYLALGALIETVSGQSYEDYVIENVLKPAGMELTNFVYTSEMSAHEASGSHPLLSMYTPMLPFLLDMKKLVSKRQGSVYWFNRFYLDVTPSSGLIGSVDDAAKFMITYMDSEILLSDESKGFMQPKGDLPTKRALGWSNFGLDERLWMQHRGGGPGFATIMRIYPQESLGIVVMANGTNLPAENIVNILVNLFHH